MTTDTTDDQELARALAGMNSELGQTVGGDTSAALSFEETPAPASVPQPPTAPAAPATPVVEPLAPVAPAAPVVDEPAQEPVATPAAHDGTELDTIKKDALGELRPLVDKLSVPADEKFDTYLLLLRSTDDASLIAPAHAAAKEIPDEARRAQALLDVIKEIDYLTASAKK